MKNTILFLVLLLSFSLFGQKSINIANELGVKKVTNVSCYKTANEDLLVVGGNSKILYDQYGNKKDQFVFNHVWPKSFEGIRGIDFGYNIENDFFYWYKGTVFNLIKNFSKQDAQYYIYKCPPLIGLIGSTVRPFDKGIASGSGPVVNREESRIHVMNSQNEVLIISSYISASKNSHGTQKPDKDKYNSFVRIMTCTNTNEIKEKIILKDVFDEQRKDDNLLKLKAIDLVQGKLIFYKIFAGKPVNKENGLEGYFKVLEYDINSESIEEIAVYDISLPNTAYMYTCDVDARGIVLTFFEKAKEHNHYYRNMRFYEIRDGAIESKTVRFKDPMHDNDVYFGSLKAYTDSKGNTFGYYFCLDYGTYKYKLVSVDENDKESNVFLLADGKVSKYYESTYSNSLILEFEYENPDLLNSLSEYTCDLCESAFSMSNNVVFINNKKEYYIAKVNICPNNTLITFISLGKIE